MAKKKIAVRPAAAPALVLSPQMELQNSLPQLLSNLIVQSQSNLTSLNPMIQNNLYTPLSINWILLTYMYKTHGIIQTAIDMPVLDALRGGLEIQSGELDIDDIKQLSDYLEENDILQTIGQAQIWARLYGGGALIINTEQDPSEPFDPKQLNNSRLELYAANRWELTSNTGWKPQNSTLPNLMPWQASSMIPDQANRDSEYFYFYSRKIHKSRIITLTGKEAPYIIKWQLAGWGMSEIEKMVEDFNKYLRTSEVTYELLEEAKLDVYKLKGLNAQLASKAGTDGTTRRISTMNGLKNFNNALVLDMEDDYIQKQITFAGLAEVMKENRIAIASALRIPMTKLYGMSASGFNSGEDDIENYNAMIESEVREKIKMPVKNIVNIVCQHLFGFEPDLSAHFKPLRVMSSKEEEEVKASKHTRYIGLYQAQVINSRELGEIMEKENMVPIETEAAKGLLDEHPTNPNDEIKDGEGKSKEEEKAND